MTIAEVLETLKQRKLFIVAFAAFSALITFGEEKITETLTRGFAWWGLDKEWVYSSPSGLALFEDVMQVCVSQRNQFRFVMHIRSIKFSGLASILEPLRCDDHMILRGHFVASSEGSEGSKCEGDIEIRGYQGEAIIPHLFNIRPVTETCMATGWDLSVTLLRRFDRGVE
jgi:hypothetical protein